MQYNVDKILNTDETALTSTDVSIVIKFQLALESSGLSIFQNHNPVYPVQRRANLSRVRHHKLVDALVQYDAESLYSGGKSSKTSWNNENNARYQIKSHCLDDNSFVLFVQ